MSNKTQTPFHDAETAVQARLGLAEQLAVRYQGFIRPYMPDQHRDFYASLPMIIVGITDLDGNVWSTPLFGQKGFISTPSATEISVNSQIPLATVIDLKLEKNSKIGLLGIELDTRRRNRVNGVIESLINKNTSKIIDGMTIKVDQSYGNCPQYIHKRQIALVEEPFLHPNDTQFEKSDSITATIKCAIEKADTFFIASRTKVFNEDPRSGVDSSHRGGTAGFVKVNANTLIFPDFSGNKFFNTIGNIQADCRVGLFFPNFENGDAVFISGRASVLWDKQLLKHYHGAERFIQVDCEQIISSKGFMPVNGKLTETSPSFSGDEAWQV